MVYDLLTEKDKDLIFNYICANVGTPKVTIDKLLQPWNHAKSEYLQKVFGDKLIITKDIEFAEGVGQIQDKINDLYNEERFYGFESMFFKAVQRYADLNFEYGENYWDLKRIFSSYTLAKNHLTESIIITFKEGGPSYTFHKGMKPLKVISKIMKIIGWESPMGEDGISDFEYFRRKHSTCLNQKLLKGKLCLSIHPLDYMTMSDNAEHWCSCMNWLDEGEYRQGTVEMMNSRCAIVAYLADENPEKFSWYNYGKNYHWNSKKWRSLFLIDKNFSISVKGYPYQNENLVKEVLNIISELQGWTGAVVEDYEEYCAPSYCNNQEIGVYHVNGHTASFNFEANTMYNDFGSCDHYIVINPNLEKDLSGWYCYSGFAECMRCGFVEFGHIHDSESSLVCDQCAPPAYSCECCGDDVYERDVCYTDDDRCLCRYCYENETWYDTLTQETLYCRDSKTRIWLADENGKVSGDFDYHFCTDGYNIGTGVWENAFTCKQPHFDPNTCRNYILPKECKPAGAEAFGYYRYEDFCEEYNIERKDDNVA